MLSTARMQMLDSNEGCWHLTCAARNHRIESEGEVVRGPIHFCRKCRAIVSSGDDFAGRCPHCGLRTNE